MKFFGPRKEKTFYLLRFEKDEPVWDLIAHNQLQRVDPPPAQTKLPILAVIPDRYFFFYLPRQIHNTQRKNMHQAAELQLKHLFPPSNADEDRQLLDTGQEILGVFSGSKVQSFVHKNSELLTRASIVTTPFLIARALASPSDSITWSMHNSEDPFLLCTVDTLHYLSDEVQEVDYRLQTIHSSRPEHLDFEDLVLQLATRSIPWSRLRIPLPELGSKTNHVRSMFKAAAALLLIGLIFCAGEALKLRSAVQYKDQWLQSLDALYIQALGPDYGNDPYGLLLYQAQEAQGQDSNRLDFLDFLGRMSKVAPNSLEILDMSLNTDTGTIQAVVNSFEQMETFVRELQALDSYAFTLDQADSNEQGVQFTLQVTIE
jgi:hypothetical protein